MHIPRTQDTLPVDGNVLKPEYLNLTTEFFARTAIADALEEVQEQQDSQTQQGQAVMQVIQGQQRELEE